MPPNSDKCPRLRRTPVLADRRYRQPQKLVCLRGRASGAGPCSSLGMRPGYPKSDIRPNWRWELLTVKSISQLELDWRRAVL